MVVLQVCAFGAPQPGNFISSLLELEEELKKQGISTIYAFAETAIDKTWCKEICKKAKVYFLPVYHARVRLKTYNLFRRIYAENNIDIVHSHFELYDIPATIMAPPKTRVFWHLHDPIKEYYKKARFTRRVLYHFQYGTIGKRAILLSVSKEHAEFAISLGFKEDKVHYVPNGINTERIRCSFLPDKPMRFLMFGWDVIRKGVDLVVESDKQLSKDLTDYEILVVGQQNCRDYLANCPTNHIRFLSPVDDVNALYSTSKVFLHVSRAEGLSYALLESIYAGLFVICSDIPENQIARVFKGVRFVKVNESEDISDAMREQINNKKGLQEADYLHNKRIIEKEYSVSAWVRRIQSFYFA